MEFKRVIRFQDDSAEESKPEIKKESISSNDDTLKENTQEDNMSLEEETQKPVEKPYNAVIQLKEYLTMVLSGRRAGNMIGVFGINSDRVVYEVCQSDIIRNVETIGKIEYSGSSDIYNSIAAMLLNCVREKFERRYDLDYYVRELYIEIEKIYDDYDDDYYRYASPLVAMSKVAQRQQRDRNILTVFNKIKQIGNYSHFSSDTRTKFLMVVELEKVDYNVLNKLSKLNSQELVIIVYSILGINIINNMVDSNGVRMQTAIDKFFPVGNYIIAN